MTESPKINFDLDYCSRNYLDFKLAKVQNPKTWVIDVIAKDSGILLGTIKWYAHWRQYAFYPEVHTVFEQICLKDITELCRRLNVIQRAGIKPQMELSTS